ncbi:Iron-regulated protein frpC (plasmid) [Roseomonas mucosa]|uniref:Iron-regulated protein frpC n=1 Tax=Roseomonas mucosa TaxID=207340 RepID=A0A4Y1MQQ5_9PROT|nr:Iron-regulated protein frpC [Roseomonas mucosa]
MPSDVPDLGDLSDISDYANIHTYAANGIRPSWVIPASVEGMATIASNDPVVITETGYYTLPGNKNWGASAIRSKPNIF